MHTIILKSPVLERLTDAEFFQLCQDNRDQRIERDANHQISILPPASSETAAANNELSYQLTH